MYALFSPEGATRYISDAFHDLQGQRYSLLWPAQCPRKADPGLPAAAAAAETMQASAVIVTMLSLPHLYGQKLCEPQLQVPCGFDGDSVRFPERPE